MAEARSNPSERAKGPVEETECVVWPKRAVVTAGMPYGNKALHFGHIGGVFIPADAFARFLRDRIGAQNVRFVSGTDCYGSPIEEGFRKAAEAGFQGTIADYVMHNHEEQARVLRAFDVDLDIFEGSGIGHAGQVHEQVSDAFVRSLHKAGHLHLEETLQFYDTQANMFLNGRQVRGKYCPVQGCKAESAYADECSDGHQYSPVDLPSPISSVSGTEPELRPVKNWYFDLPNFADFLEGHVKVLDSDPEVRPILPKDIREFLAPPVIFVKCECEDAYRQVMAELPPHTFTEAPKGKQSFELQFDCIQDRDAAKSILESAQIRFRTSKTLVPFRMTGVVEWGVPAPVMDGVDGRTIWCWPESLWAPISFTIAVNDALGLPRSTYKDFWCSDDAEVFQFIGQDNIYFYGVAQPALWEAVDERVEEAGKADDRLRQTRLIANHHLLYGKTKASSSGTVKPPSGDDLLEHYTSEQLRAHFLALGLGQKAVKFNPKPFDMTLSDEDRQNPRIADPALKEGALLTNVFNRLARSCFYESAKSFDGYMPLGEVSPEAVSEAHKALGEYEALMHKVELHSVMQLMDAFIRFSNKWWSDSIKAASDAEAEEAGKTGGEKAAQAASGIAGEGDASPAIQSEPSDLRRQALVDAYYLLRICTLLMHPIVPKGCEAICDYMDFDASEFFSWNYDFESNMELCGAAECDDGRHQVRELPPKFDFFKKHPSQYK